MYVDDVLSVADTLLLAQSKAEQLNSLLMADGFRLHKWMANDPAILAGIQGARSEFPAARDFSLDTFPGLSILPGILVLLQVPASMFMVDEHPDKTLSAFPRRLTFQSIWLDRCDHHRSKDFFPKVMKTSGGVGLIASGALVSTLDGLLDRPQHNFHHFSFSLAWHPSFHYHKSSRLLGRFQRAQSRVLPSQRLVRWSNQSVTNY